MTVVTCSLPASSSVIDYNKSLKLVIIYSLSCNLQLIINNKLSSVIYSKITIKYDHVITTGKKFGVTSHNAQESNNLYTMPPFSDLLKLCLYS